MSGPTAIDLFCGAGGFTAGLRWAGYDVVGALDNDEQSTETYTENFETDSVVTADIRETPPEEVHPGDGTVDLLVGGPPCPTFSVAGRSKIESLEDGEVLTDERHYLFEEFLRYVRTLRPRAVVMENVPGMRTAETESGTNVVRRIRRELQESGYRVTLPRLDAADFGVPQHRERLFFVANRLDVPNPVMDDWRTHREPVNDDERKITPLSRRDPSQATLGSFGVVDESGPALGSFAPDRSRRNPHVTVGDALLDLPPLSPNGETPPTGTDQYTVPPLTEYQSWVRDIEDEDWQAQELHNHECRNHNMTDLSLYKLLGEGVGWTIDALPDEFHPYRTDVFRDQYRKQNPRKPATTVVAHIQKDGHLSIHPREARSFSVREAARLQSFRDSFVFPVARSAAFRQVGNAVPPLVAQALGEAIKATVLAK